VEEQEAPEGAPPREAAAGGAASAEPSL